MTGREETLTAADTSGTAAEPTEDQRASGETFILLLRKAALLKQAALDSVIGIPSERQFQNKVSR